MKQIHRNGKIYNFNCDYLISGYMFECLFKIPAIEQIGIDPSPVLFEDVGFHYVAFSPITCLGTGDLSEDYNFWGFK